MSVNGFLVGTSRSIFRGKGGGKKTYLSMGESKPSELSGFRRISNGGGVWPGGNALVLPMPAGGLPSPGGGALPARLTSRLDMALSVGAAPFRGEPDAEDNSLMLGPIGLSSFSSFAA